MTRPSTAAGQPNSEAGGVLRSAVHAVVRLNDVGACGGRDESQAFSTCDRHLLGKAGIEHPQLRVVRGLRAACAASLLGLRKWPVQLYTQDERFTLRGLYPVVTVKGVAANRIAGERT